MKFNHMSTPDQQGKNPESSYVGPPSLYPLQVVLCTLIFHIAGVERGSGLEKHDPALFFGDRLMLDAARNDDEFSFADPFMAFAKGFIADVHAEAAFDDQEHFVLVVVVMPYEFRVGLHQLDNLPVELAGDMRLVVFGNFREFFGDVDLVHKNPIAAAKKRSQEVGGKTDASVPWVSEDGSPRPLRNVLEASNDDGLVRGRQSVECPEIHPYGKWMLRDGRRVRGMKRCGPQHIGRRADGLISAHDRKDHAAGTPLHARGREIFSFIDGEIEVVARLPLMVDRRVHGEIGIAGAGVGPLREFNVYLVRAVDADPVFRSVGEQSENGDGLHG